MCAQKRVIAAAKFDVENCHNRHFADDDSVTIDGLVTEPAGLCTIAEILPSQEHLPMLVRLVKKVKPSVCCQSGLSHEADVPMLLCKH